MAPDDVLRPQLAQFNLAVLRHPMGHPATKGFEDLIDDTNAHAEAAPGFVWRHGIDTREVDDLPYDDKHITVNASVWESAEHLRDFAYRGFHRDVYRRRSEWFTDSAAVMWWLPRGTLPTMHECLQRMDHFAEFGSTPYAFTTGERMPVLVVRRHTLAEPVAQELIGHLNTELRAATPAGASNFFHLEADKVDDPHLGGFFIGWLDGSPVACAAWRRIDDDAGRPDTGEVKRMWASPEVRGARVGAALLSTVHSAAREQGITELRLETGEYLQAAVALYRRFGFAACESWGEYVGAPQSYTMSKPIGPINHWRRPTAR
jgi:GNAT superfamily N-acetyltransferase